MPGSTGWPPIRLRRINEYLARDGAALITPGTQAIFLEELQYFHLLEPANDESI